MPITLCNGHTTPDGYTSPCDNRDVEFVGAVLETYEENGYDDSDFYAVVWDAEAGKVRSVTYASTRSWTYHNGATVDATPEAQDAALAWYRAEYLRITTLRAEQDARRPERGDLVRSLTTRGKAKGVVGEVAWSGTNDYRNRYGRSPEVRRFGLRVAGREDLVYVDANRVELVEVPAVDAAALRARAEVATPANWYSALHLPRMLLNR